LSPLSDDHDITALIYIKPGIGNVNPKVEPVVNPADELSQDQSLTGIRFWFCHGPSAGFV
jgi:hypothetical protein